jgi:RNA-directed DNA polymerase
VISPLLANIYLSELDAYLAGWTERSHQEKKFSRSGGQSNFAYVRYADDFVVLCNGTKEKAEEMKGRLQRFLQQELHLTLSEEKTAITHLNEGFEFLGFEVKRCMGQKRMVTKVRIPHSAFQRVMAKVASTTAPYTHKDSLNTTILALNRIIGGWCQYYQYTAQAGRDFNYLHHLVYWKLVHWMGRKFQMNTPEILQKYERDSTIATEAITLIKAHKKYPPARYRETFYKPNPYTTQEVKLERETPLRLTNWTGVEERPGISDLLREALKRDHYRCITCGADLNEEPWQIDHKRPVRRFRRPVDANRLENLQSLCIPCHSKKTQSDRQMESRVH